MDNETYLKEAKRLQDKLYELKQKAELKKIKDQIKETKHEIYGRPQTMGDLLKRWIKD